MSTTYASIHNRGARRVLSLARETADLVKANPGADPARDRVMIETLSTFASEAEALLLPEPAGDAGPGDADDA